MPAFLYCKGDTSLFLARESQTNAFRTKGDKLPFIYGVTNSMASASSAFLFNFFTAFDITALMIGYSIYSIRLS